MTHRVTITLIAFLTVFLATPTYAVEKTVSEISDYAMIMASEKRYDDALNIIMAQSEVDQKSYALKFTKARILAWSGNYHKARPIFEDLKRTYPNNSDVLVSFAYMEFFSGNIDIAERYFNRVITDHPLYVDAHTGLERILKTRMSAASVQNNTRREIIPCPDGYDLNRNGYCHRQN